MQVINNLKMLSMAVNSMPGSKEFYEKKLGLKVVADYRQDDKNWWVSLAFPGGGATITLTTNFEENLRPGTMKLYFETSDIKAAHTSLSGKDVKISAIKDDLNGPGSGVKWLDFKDPDNNHILVSQA